MQFQKHKKMGNRPQLSKCKTNGTTNFVSLTHVDLLEQVDEYFTSPEHCNDYLVAYVETYDTNSGNWTATVITSINS